MKKMSLLLLFQTYAVVGVSVSGSQHSIKLTKATIPKITNKTPPIRFTTLSEIFSDKYLPESTAKLVQNAWPFKNFHNYYKIMKFATRIAPKQIINALNEAERAIVVYCDLSPHSAKKVKVKDWPKINRGVKRTLFFLIFEGEFRGLASSNYIHF